MLVRARFVIAPTASLEGAAPSTRRERDDSRTGAVDEFDHAEGLIAQEPLLVAVEILRAEQRAAPSRRCRPESRWGAADPCSI